jgi:hypothetical protein
MHTHLIGYTIIGFIIGGYILGGATMVKSQHAQIAEWQHEDAITLPSHPCAAHGHQRSMMDARTSGSRPAQRMPTGFRSGQERREAVMTG